MTGSFLYVEEFYCGRAGKVIKAQRSNCELDTTKLEAKLKEYGITVPEVHVAYRQCFERMKENLRRERMVV